MISHPPDDQNHDPSSGRFLPRNQASKGRASPYARDSVKKKQAIIAACTPSKVKEVLDALFKEAIGGNVAAAATWLNRACGKITDDPLMLERLARIEESLGIASADLSFDNGEDE